MHGFHMNGSVKESVSVSIVSYNTRDSTLACIASVLSSRNRVAIDVTVVDNASRDGTADAIAERFPQVKLVRNSANRFFAAAHNQALKEAGGDFVLILNSDTELAPTTIADMVEFMDSHPDVGAATCLFLDSQKRMMRPHLHNYWRFHSLWRNLLGRHNVGLRAYRLLAPSATKTNDVAVSSTIIYTDVVSDTFLMARREALSAVGFYDESFLLYATEDDLCRRIAEASWKVAVNPQVKIVHQLSGSVRRVPAVAVRRIFRDDSITYYRKHGTLVERVLAPLLLRLVFLVEAVALTLGYGMHFRG